MAMADRSFLLASARIGLAPLANSLDGWITSRLRPALARTAPASSCDNALEAAAEKNVALALANIGSAKAALDLAKIVLDYTI